jgi:predicted metal-dependent hydrolase
MGLLKARPRNLALLTDDEFEARRPLLLAGVEQFNDGYFFEAHETWEELWLPSPWPARNFLQGIIQLAAAFVHLMRHEYPGTVRLLDAGLKKIEGFPPDFLGIDGVRLVAEARRARDALIALGPERFEKWDLRHIPRLHLIERRRRSRNASAGA